MKKHVFVFTLIAFCLLSCSPSIRSSIVASKNVLPFDAEVFVFNLKQALPIKSLKKVGTISLGDSGFTVKCGYDVMINKAKIEARKAGANVIKITEHKKPSVLGSSCHRFKMTLYYISNTDKLKDTSNFKEPELLDVDYALLHVYRYPDAGSLIAYNLKLSDSILCRVKNNFKTTLKIKEAGLNKIWAKTESKVALPFNVKHGKQYYLRCGVKTGLLIGRPTLEFVDYQTGKSEFESFKAKHTK